jgi:hypothetical protein
MGVSLVQNGQPKLHECIGTVSVAFRTLGYMELVFFKNSKIVFHIFLKNMIFFVKVDNDVLYHCEKKQYERLSILDCAKFTNPWI